MLQKLVIDCQTGEASYVKMSDKEETDRLKEIEDIQVEELERRKIEAKRQLAKALAELREMGLNKNVFTDEDIAGKQDEIIAMLQSASLPILPVVASSPHK